MSKRKDIRTRVVFGVIFTLVFIPGIIISSLWQYTWVKSVTFAIYSIAGMFAIYEGLCSMKINKTAAIISMTFIPLFFLISKDGSTRVILTANDNTTISYFAKIVVGDWSKWVLIIAFPLVPLLISYDPKSFKWSHVTITYIIFSFIAIFGNVFWLYNISGFKYIGYFLGIPIIADSFAYFGGMLVGKKWFKGKKLAPTISPKKTWGGFVIGFVVSLAFAIGAGYGLDIWKEFESAEIPVLIVFSFLLCIVSPFGDLLFSGIKRMLNIKDFSNMIPGHGGILDRLDSISTVFAISAVLYAFVGI